MIVFDGRGFGEGRAAEIGKQLHALRHCAYLISPSVMIHAFQMNNAPQIIEGLKLSVMLAVFFHVVLIVLGRVFKSVFKLDALEHAATVPQQFQRAT